MPHKIITANGQTRTADEWAKLTGIKRTTITMRLRMGWPADAAVTVPTPRQIRRGVGLNFQGLEGTGGGPSLQETRELQFAEVTP